MFRTAQLKMSDNSFSKLWIQTRQNDLAIARATQEIKRQGRRLPCRVTEVIGAIVVVEFEADLSPWSLPPIKIPKAESPWIRMPTQVGDFGYTQPADVYLDAVSGLGSGGVDDIRTCNLSALVFVPVSSAKSGPIDPNAAQVQGPNGVIIRTTQGTVSSIVTNQSGTTITFGSTTLVVNAEGIVLTAGGQTFTWASGGANSTVPITTPDVILPNGAVNEHTHPGVQTGNSNTGVMTG